MRVSFPVDFEPLTDFEPDQLPEALQESALVEVQLNFAELLYEIVIGPLELLALIFTVGASILFLQTRVLIHLLPTEQAFEFRKLFAEGTHFDNLLLWQECHPHLPLFHLLAHL